jgi:phosphoribosylformimino-5-aminoimidazole carboxamide ribotide isomerase
MIVFPAIDIKEGRCVRLKQGDPEKVTVYGTDPVKIALQWQEQGAQWLHVVDLDGAFARTPVNHQVIHAMVKAVSIPVQVGGGIRTLATMEEYLRAGVKRVILGSVALRDPALLADACGLFPQQVALGIDAREGRVAIEGWKQTTGMDVTELVNSFRSLSLAAVIYTDIHRDGMQSGVNLEATRALLEATDFPVIASGGVADLRDIEALLPLVSLGLEGVITGKAIYDGTLKLPEALALVRKSAKVDRYSGGKEQRTL